MENEKVRLVELFAGIGAQAQALKDNGTLYEATVCEIDGHAYRSYCAVHGDTPNLGDITKVEELPECDIVTWSFPCQSLSNAGKQDGFVEGSGTKSSLGWEVIRLLRTMRSHTEREDMPLLLMENVPAILNKRNRDEFARMRDALRELGYTNTYGVLNARDHGIPQNRKRCFMVSVPGDAHFRFPQPRPLTRCLKDMLQDRVDERYYLSDEKISKYEEHLARHRAKGHGLGWKPRTPEEVAPAVLTNPTKGDTMSIIVRGSLNRGYDMSDRIYDADGISPTVPTACGGGHIPRKRDDVIEWPSGTTKGYMDAREGDGLVMNRTITARGTVQPQSVPTLTTGGGCGTGVVDSGLRIRYLTPLECWRLMGFHDDAYHRAAEVCSENQLYRQAGNSIVVDVLREIFRNMLCEGGYEWYDHPVEDLEWVQGE